MALGRISGFGQAEADDLERLALPPRQDVSPGCPLEPSEQRGRAPLRKLGPVGDAHADDGHDRPRVRPSR